MAVGNERSANFGNGFSYLGADVNHQWEKGLAFERSLSDYIDGQLLRGFRYFSPLATLWEVQIAGYFALKCSPFFSSFCSCNSYNGNDWASDWCCRCAKCLFVYILLSAWLPPESVQSIFGGRDLLGTYGPTRHLDGLLGHGHKPLDCVGTADEASASLRCAAARHAAAPPWAIRLSEASWRGGDMGGLVREFGEAPGTAPKWFSQEAVHEHILDLLLPRIPEPPCATAAADESSLDIPGSCWDC